MASSKINLSLKFIRSQVVSQDPVAMIRSLKPILRINNKYWCLNNVFIRHVHESNTEKERSTRFSFLESKLAPDFKELKKEISKNRITRTQIYKKHAGIIREISMLRGSDYFLRYFSFFKVEDVDKNKLIMKTKKYAFTGALLYLPYKMSFMLMGFINQGEALRDLIMTEGCLAFIVSVSLIYSWKYR